MQQAREVNTANTTWLSEVVASIDGRLKHIVGRSHLLLFPPVESLVLGEGADGFDEWAANGQYGKFEPPLSRTRYTADKALEAKARKTAHPR